MHKVRFFTFTLLLATCFSAFSTPLDSNLKKFLEYEIKDAALLEEQIKMYSEGNLTFEDFIFSVFVGAVQYDSTGNNSLFLSKIGSYLDSVRPELTENLEKGMEKFLSIETNRTMMREMLLSTVKGLRVKR